jgi:hypothetical protein
MKAVAKHGGQFMNHTDSLTQQYRAGNTYWKLDT